MSSSRTCYERYYKVISVCRVFARLCGADIFVPNYRINALTCVVVLAINAFFACTGYTIYMGVIVDGDWKVMLPALCLVASGVQGYSKLLLCLYRREVMVDMLNSLNSIYWKYQEKSQTYQNVLNYRTNLVITLLKTTLMIYIFTFVVVVAYPLVFWMLYDVKMPIMQFLMPRIDSNSENGYIAHVVCHVFCMALGGLGNFTGDMFMFIFIINIPLLKDILELKLDDLNEVALATHDPKKTMPLLSDIIEWHQKYNEFVRQIEEVYYGVILVEVMTLCCGICFTLFSLVIGEWPAAFAYLIYSFILLYAFCGLGHLVEISNDQVTDAIYTRCLWYKLSLPEQKFVLLMIRKSQRPTTLTIGLIYPLSMSSALQLTKAIYSYMMMLINFLETDDM